MIKNINWIAIIGLFIALCSLILEYMNGDGDIEPSFLINVKSLNNEEREIWVETLDTNVSIQSVTCQIPKSFINNPLISKTPLIKQDRVFKLKLNNLIAVINQKKNEYQNGFETRCLPINFTIEYVQDNTLHTLNRICKLKYCIMSNEYENGKRIKVITVNFFENAITLIEKHDGKNVDEKLDKLYHNIYNCQSNECNTNQ